jgi:uncharacterized protein involved in cysteine biosynthesis
MPAPEPETDIDPRARTEPAIAPQEQEPRPAPGPSLCPLCMWPDPGPERCGLRATNAPKGMEVGAGFFLFDALDGFRELFGSLVRLLHDRAYFGRLILPVAANIVAVLATTFGFLTLLLPFFTGLVEQKLWLVTWLERIGRSIGPTIDTDLALATVATMHLAPALLVTVTAPFLDDLATTTEREMCGSAGKHSAGTWWKSVWTGTHTTARLLLWQIAALPVGLLLSLLGLWFWLVALGLSAYLNAMVWFDLPFTRRGYGIDQRVRILRNNWGRALGFGFAFQMALMLPFVNLMLLPATAIATTRLFYRMGKVAKPEATPKG